MKCKLFIAIWFYAAYSFKAVKPRLHYNEKENKEVELRDLMKRKISLIALLFLTFAIRFAAAIYVEGGTMDIYNFAHTSELVLNGALNIYETDAAYNYPPLFAFVIAGVMHLSIISGLSFFILFKSLSILADVGITYILFNSTEDNRSSLYRGLFYALNPVSIWITSLHGQFDSLPILFSLMSWMYFKKSKMFLSSISLSAGVMLKIFPILLLIPFLQKINDDKERYKFATITIIPTILLLIPFFINSPFKIINNVLGYSPSAGWFGYTFILYRGLGIPVDFFQIYGKFILLVAYILLLKYVTPKLQLEKAIAATFLIVYVFSSGVAEQYLVWILPFAGLLINYYSIAYSILGILGIMPRELMYRNNYPSLNFLREWIFRGEPITISNPGIILQGIFYSLLWLLCIFWFYQTIADRERSEMKRMKQEAAGFSP